MPVLAAYFYLEFRGAQLGTNASYDAYKLFAVFLPVLLPAFCWWVTLRRSRRLTDWFGVVGIAAVVLAFNVAAAGMFVWKLQKPPLIVDGEMRQWRKIEAMADVDSLNLVLPTMWERLWANAFLLKKPHYFPTDTYEARWHTELKGNFDFEGGVVALKLPGAGRRELSPHYALVDTRSDGFVRVSLTDGWSEQEQAPGGGGGQADRLGGLEEPADHPGRPQQAGNRPVAGRACEADRLPDRPRIHGARDFPRALPARADTARSDQGRERHRIGHVACRRTAGNSRSCHRPETAGNPQGEAELMTTLDCGTNPQASPLS